MIKFVLPTIVLTLAITSCSTEMEQRTPATTPVDQYPNGTPGGTNPSNPVGGGSGFNPPTTGGTGGTGTCNANFTQNLASLINTSGAATVPILGAINFTMQANASMAITGTAQQGSVALAATITSFAPALGRNLADNIIQSFRDPLVLTFASDAERQQLFASAPWQGLDCLIMPIKSIRNNAYEYQYEPALPMLVSPNGSAEAITAIGNRSFPNISARILRHPTAQPGSHQGTASITATGSNVSIDYDFGGVAPRANATPIKAIAYELGAASDGYRSVTMRAFVSDNSLVNLQVNK